MMEVEKEDKLGSSKAQVSIEEHIFKQIKNGLFKIDGINLDEIVTGNPEAKGTKFQVDFFIPNSLLGEVYTCKSKLLAGQRKKIYSDILKMLTIEKIWEKSVPKVILMVLSQNDFTGKKIPIEQLISKTMHEDEYEILNNLGHNSWIQKTIELFGIQIYYYLLNPDLSHMLEIQQANQKR